MPHGRATMIRMGLLRTTSPRWYLAGEVSEATEKAAGAAFNVVTSRFGREASSSRGGDVLPTPVAPWH